MSTVVGRYLSRELMQSWLIVLLMLWLVLVAARFSLYLGQAAAGRLPADAVLWLLVLKSVGFLVFLMPLGFFLAMLWLSVRLNRDCETLALAASGFGNWQLLRALAIPVGAVTLAVAVLSGYLVPETARMGYEFRAEVEQRLDVRTLVPGHFQELRGGRWLVYVERAGADSGTLEGVFVYARHPRRPQVLVAERARIQEQEAGEGDARYLLLQHGYRYDGWPGQADYRVLRYQEYAVRLGEGSGRLAHKRDAVSSGALWKDTSLSARAEWQMRLSRPLSVPVLALLAIPLSRFRPGASRYYPIWMGVLFFTVYFNLLGTAQLWMEQGRVSAWLGLWWVHLLVAAPAAGWLAWSHGWRARRTAS